MELVRNIFPQSLTRYITYGEDLLAYLQEMYGYDIDFCITVSPCHFRVSLESHLIDRSTRMTGGFLTAQINSTM
jgi:hypothetical protein